MSVGLRVGDHIEEVGTADFLNAFFSTVSSLLEPRGWGTRYPELMNELYKGCLDHRLAEKVIQDIKTVRSSLRQFSPDKVVWDIEDPQKQPPWGETISEDIKDLSTYFVTSAGDDLIDVIERCLHRLASSPGAFLLIERQ